MIALKLNTTKDQAWDIVITNGDIELITDNDYIPQKIKQLLLFIRGEFFRDTSAGVPWFDTILGQKNPDLATINTIIVNTILKNKILSDLGVTGVTVTDITTDYANRSMSLKLEIKTINATTATELII